MKTQAAERSRAQRRALAEYLSGRSFGAEQTALPPSAFCSPSAAGHESKASASWNGWGAGPANARFQPAAAAGMTALDLPRLKLKWAFGLPGASSAGTQPVVFEGRLYVGDAEGDLFALDAKSGCIIWHTEVEAGIRGTPIVGDRAAGGRALYVGDQAANMYAVDAPTGKVLWKVKADNHPQAAITGGAALHAGVLYVPVSSREESKVADPRYPCCTFRGSILALEAASGRKIWKTYTLTEKPVPGLTNSAGTVVVGPSGAPVWNAPTIDAKRQALYFGTGNNYSPPATSISDAVVALDIKSGKIKWRRQQTENDIWSAACRGAAHEIAACPDENAPDADISASAILAETPHGKSILIAANKAGLVWALDPENSGKPIWKRQVGKGSARGGVLWGLAVDGARVYVPNGYFDPKEPDGAGGITALDLRDGRVLWSASNPPCNGREHCMPSHAAAVTAIPGVLFSGTMDGHLYAYAADTGQILWQFDSAQEYATVNGVKSSGGSMSNGGAAVAGGMLYVQSGYAHHGAMAPGNALLAFAPQ